jgi:hypothetical protein
VSGACAVAVPAIREMTARLRNMAFCGIHRRYARVGNFVNPVGG